MFATPCVTERYKRHVAECRKKYNGDAEAMAKDLGKLESYRKFYGNTYAPDITVEERRLEEFEAVDKLGGGIFAHFCWHLDHLKVDGNRHSFPQLSDGFVQRHLCFLMRPGITDDVRTADVAQFLTDIDTMPDFKKGVTDVVHSTFLKEMFTGGFVQMCHEDPAWLAIAVEEERQDRKKIKEFRKLNARLRQDWLNAAQDVVDDKDVDPSKLAYDLGDAVWYTGHGRTHRKQLKELVSKVKAVYDTCKARVVSGDADHHEWPVLPFAHNGRDGFSIGSSTQVIWRVDGEVYRRD